MARTKSEQFPEIQRNILKRAAAVFARVGYASSTISDLASATELSRGALYHYFNSKEAILCNILDDHLERFLEMIEKVMATGLDPADQLRCVTREIVRFNSECPDEQVLILNDINQLAAQDRDRMQGLQRMILDRVCDLLIRLDKNGKITTANKRVYTMMYFGIVNYTFAWYDPKGRVSPDEFAELACDLFLNGLLGTPEPARVAEPEQVSLS